MKRSLLTFLKPPTSDAEFRLIVDKEDGDEVMEGWLVAGDRRYPIRGGVPRLLPEAVHQANWETASRFGEEWKQFSMITDEYEKQFLSWIEPVTAGHFVGKTVLDLGCGKGRHVLQAKKFGAKEVIGVDLSQAVDVAFANVGRMEGVHIIQGDIFHLPIEPASFDYGYSIGVLHHTPDPGKAFQKLVDMIRPGGSVSAWVYGREGNGWIIYLLNPFRRLTSKLPLPVTKAIAFVFAVIMQTALVALYRPAAKRSWLKRLLPYSAYLCSISGYSFKENFSIVFDHLLPEIAFYIPRNEFQSWFDRARLRDVVVTQRFGNSWRGFGRV